METLSCFASAYTTSMSLLPPSNLWNGGSVSVPGLAKASVSFTKCRRKLQNGFLTKASIAVEQQTQETKVALIRIGTRGRYTFIFNKFCLIL